jgi:di/tricarboxylate transporter
MGAKPFQRCEGYGEGLTTEIALTLGIIGAAVILFATETLRVDIIALLVLLTLAITGLIDTQEAFSGFASPAVITVWAVYIVSGGLYKTGVADTLGQQITRLAGTSEARLIFVIMATCGLMSAFMNNIGATAVLLPAVVGISRKAKVPLSKLLIPLSFSSLMGGNMTLIGTPPNVLGATILAERGLPTFEFFDFTPMGAIVFGSGILYMLLIGRHLLPKNESAEELRKLEMRQYISEVRIKPSSPLVGKTLLESRLGADYDLTVLGISRGGEITTSVHSNTLLLPNDLLIVEGAVDDLIQAKGSLNLDIEAERKLGLEEIGAESTIVEATLAPRSPIVGRSLRGMRFRDRYGFTALAIRRQGEVITQRLRDVRLRFGDTLLLQGSRRRLPELQEGNEFLVLEPLTVDVRRRNKTPIAIGAMVVVLGLVTVGGLHVATAMVIGAVMMVLGGCLTMDEAYQSIEWRSIFLIAGMLPLGTAMEVTGTARFLAEGIISIAGDLGPLAVLAGIYILAGLVTEPMSNAAAAVLIVPLAIDTALSLGANPQSFVLATIIGASTSFLTPVGHQANVLVFGPGGYRFFDYTRVGGPLNIVLLVVTLIFLPMLFPL